MPQEIFVSGRQSGSVAMLAVLATGTFALIAALAQASPADERQATIDGDCSLRADAQDLRGDSRRDFGARCGWQKAGQQVAQSGIGAPVPAAPPGWKCKSYALSQVHSRVILKVVVFGIYNDGPATIAIRTDGDKSFNSPIAPNNPVPTVFFGDSRFTYRVETVIPHENANFRICRS